MAMMPRYISDYPSHLGHHNPYPPSLPGGGQHPGATLQPLRDSQPAPVLNDPFGNVPPAPLQHNASSGSLQATQSPLAMDPSDLIWALSSQLPTIEEGAWSEGIPSDKPALLEPPPSTSPSNPRQDDHRDEGRTYKVTWWRPHGKTAIAPGECRSMAIASTVIERSQS